MNFEQKFNQWKKLEQSNEFEVLESIEQERIDKIRGFETKKSGGIVK